MIGRREARVVALRNALADTAVGVRGGATSGFPEAPATAPRRANSGARAWRRLGGAARFPGGPEDPPARTGPRIRSNPDGPHPHLPNQVARLAPTAGRRRLHGVVQRQQPLRSRPAGVAGGTPGGARTPTSPISPSSGSRRRRPRSSSGCTPRRWRPEIRTAAGSCAQVTEPYPLRSATNWGFEPGNAVAPGRRVLRRLGDGAGHEAFLVEIGGSSLAVAKLPRPRLADDVHRLVSLRDEGRALWHSAST